MSMSISFIFRIFCLVFLAIAAIAAVVSMFSAVKMRRDTALLQKLFRDCVIIAILFGVLSWLLV